MAICCFLRGIASDLLAIALLTFALLAFALLAFALITLFAFATSASLLFTRSTLFFVAGAAATSLW